MEIKCTQCGGGVGISEESGFIICPYCDSRLYVESEQTVRHLYLKPEVRPEQLSGIIGKELFKLELKGPVSVVSVAPVFLPFWLIHLKDDTLKVPAAELTNAELQKFAVPVGKLLPYDSGIEARHKVVMPELSLDQVLKRPLMEKAKGMIERSDLIHIPFYRVAYKYDDGSYQAMVDAGEGRLYAEKFPRGLSQEKDRYFLTLFGVLAAIFLVEAALIPKFWFTVLAYGITSAIGWYVVRKLLDQKGY